jgi:hypothetical protein
MPAAAGGPPWVWQGPPHYAGCRLLRHHHHTRQHWPFTSDATQHCAAGKPLVDTASNRCYCCTFVLLQCLAQNKCFGIVAHYTKFSSIGSKHVDCNMACTERSGCTIEQLMLLWPCHPPADCLRRAVRPGLPPLPQHCAQRCGRYTSTGRCTSNTQLPPFTVALSCLSVHCSAFPSHLCSTYH